MLQGAAADCNSAGETHAWFDSRVAHHFLFIYKRLRGTAERGPPVGFHMDVASDGLEPLGVDPDFLDHLGLHT